MEQEELRDRTNAGYPALSNQMLKPGFMAEPGTAIHILRRYWIPIWYRKELEMRKIVHGLIGESGMDFGIKNHGARGQNSRSRSSGLTASER